MVDEISVHIRQGEHHLSHVSRHTTNAEPSAYQLIDLVCRPGWWLVCSLSGLATYFALGQHFGPLGPLYADSNIAEDQDNVSQRWVVRSSDTR